MNTALMLLAALKFWLPMVTAFVMVYKGFMSLKTGLTSWADRLLNNHFHHLQASLEEIASSTKSYTPILEKIRDDGAAVRTDIAILKDRN